MGDDKYYRKFFLCVISAQNLRNVRKLFKNRVHARITIGGDSKTERWSPPDKRNGLNPAWNYRVGYDINESGITHHGLSVVIKLYSQHVFGDKYIGEVHTSVKELFDHAKERGGSAILALPIKKGSSDTKAVLNLSYSFGERIPVDKRSLWKWILESGAKLFLRERVGKMVLGFLQGSKRDRPARIGGWLGPVRLMNA